MSENGDTYTKNKDKNIIHYLGPPGTYSHQVALELCSRFEKQGKVDDPLLYPCNSIKSTFQEAFKRSAATSSVSWALLPYENNSNGPVLDSYDILYTLPTSVQVVDEYYLPVSHSLMCSRNVYHQLNGKTGGKEIDLKRIDVVSSHEQVSCTCLTRSLEPA